MTTTSSKIVFTGITGLLGGYFLKTKKSGYGIIGIGNKNISQNNDNFFQIDITNKKQVLDFINKINPSVIIHAASIGNVDYCERNPDEAYKVNIEGTKNIINAAKKARAKIIFLSSNAVFDGNNPLYDEKALSSPIDIYGKTKKEGESLIKMSGLNFVILRLMTMYGWPQAGGRGNPVTWIIDKLKTGEKINVVSDIYNNHLWAGQAAEVIWEILKKDIKNETYNIAGMDCISRYDLALKVAKIFELDPSLITPVTSDFFKSIAKRPKNTCFNVSKMETQLGIKAVSIDEGLALMREESK